MNDEFDPLEAELAALRPRSVSPDLEQRIAAELSRDVAPPQRRGWLIAIAAGALAASLLAALWLWRGGGETAEVDGPGPAPEMPLAAALDPALPSVWSYRPASVQAGDLDQLLDQHAGRGASPRSEYVQIRGFDVSGSQRHGLGEL